jgi:uncharacterized coiled-coil protein SlyX
MAINEVQDVRIDNLEVRVNKHDELLERMTSAQTQMMISIAKLHSSVKILLMFMTASVGLDISGLI